MANALSKWGKDFPKVGLVVKEQKKFYSLREAIPLWDCGLVEVESADNEVLEEDFRVRKMTDGENAEFQRAVDEFSANK